MQCAYCTAALADPPAPFCPNCGTATLAPGTRRESGLGTVLHTVTHPAASPTPVSVAGLGLAASILLGGVALAQLGYAFVRLTGHETTPVAIFTAVLEAVSVFVYLAWIYRARGNAGHWGPQRHSQGWAVGSWFTPVVALWFPFQIMSDVWRASMPPTERRLRPDPLVRAWWGCWLLAWVSGLSFDYSTAVNPDGSAQKHISIHDELGGSLISNLSAMLAAILGATVVTKVSRMQKARLAV